MLRPNPRYRTLFVFLLLGLFPACGPHCAPPGDPGAPPAAQAASLPAAEELMKSRDLDGALAMLQQLVAAPDAPPMAFQRLAEVHAARSDYAKGVKVLREGLERHPQSGQLSYNLARLYQRLGQYPAACEELDKARQNGASERDLALLYGTCLGQMNKLEEAAREFDRALAAGADAKTVHYNQALILKQQREFVKAQQLLEPLVAADPSFNDAKRELAHVIILGGADAASANKGLGILWDLKEPLAKDYRLHEYMGDAWMLLGDFDAALLSYTEALRYGQNPKAVEEKYATAAQKKKDEKKAKAEAEGKTAVEPERPKFKRH